MSHRVGDILIAQESSGSSTALHSKRLPARLTVEAEITWIDRKDLWVRLPEARVVFADQTLRLPSSKIKLARQTEAFSWRSQAFETVEATSWDAAPFYGRLKGQKVTQSQASYYTRAAWTEHERSLGDLPQKRPLDGLAAYAACLGVALDASRDQVLAAFRLKAKAAHPDAGGNPEDFNRLLVAREALLLEK